MEMINHFMLTASIALITIAFLITCVTLIRPNTTLGRILSLELLANITLGIIALYAVKIHSVFFLDICVALALIAFLTAVAYCHFVYVRLNRYD